MSSTLLEVTRSAHEDVERLERLIVKDLQNEPPSNKDRLFQSHRVRQMIDTIIATTEKLVIILPFILHSYIFISDSKYWNFEGDCEQFQVEVYEDKDNARKDEIAALGGQTATGTNVFSAFYDRLKEVIVN